MGQTGFCENLRVSAVFCENLRFPAVFGKILRLRNAVIPRKSKNQRKTPNSVPFVPFSLSLLIPLEDCLLLLGIPQCACCTLASAPPALGVVQMRLARQLVWRWHGTTFSTTINVFLSVGTSLAFYRGQKGLPRKLRKKSENGFPGPRQRVENDYFSSFLRVFDSFSTLFRAFLTPGPRGPGNPFSDIFGVFWGEAF